MRAIPATPNGERTLGLWARMQSLFSELLECGHTPVEVLRDAAEIMDDMLKHRQRVAEANQAPTVERWELPKAPYEGSQGEFEDRRANPDANPLTEPTAAAEAFVDAMDDSRCPNCGLYHFIGWDRCVCGEQKPAATHRHRTTGELFWFCQGDVYERADGTPVLLYPEDIEPIED